MLRTLLTTRVNQPLRMCEEVREVAATMVVVVVVAGFVVRIVCVRIVAVGRKL